MFIDAENAAFSYMGRIERQNNARTFYYAGSMAIIKCSGTKFGIRLKNHHLHSTSQIGFVVDGVVQKVDLPYDDDIHDITLCQGLDDIMHEVIIFKSHGAANYFDLFGLICDDNAKYEKSKLPTLKIECYGDSVSAGEVCEATDCCGKNDPQDHNGRFDNAWYSFTMQTARLLGAQIHNIAQGGIALRDNTGYYDDGQVGLQTVFDKTCYLPYVGYTEWDFTKYIPDIVVIAIGQNDTHNQFGEDFDIADSNYRKVWKSAYLDFISKLRAHYRDAYFVLCTTVLMHSSEWDKAIDEVKLESGDPKVRRVYFSRNGSATPGHPRIEEQAEMAHELAHFIQSEGMIADRKQASF